jgi:hypothetical protein
MADEKKEESFLGASVPKDLHTLFKITALQRGESMQEAVVHAARIYIDIKPEKETQ